MKKMRNRLAGFTVVLILVGTACTLTWAEVSIRTDREGDYVTTQVIPTGPKFAQEIWTVRPGRLARQATALNPQGDRNGDLWPTIAESPLAPHYPLVLWSRFHENEYDLAWSVWTDEGWSPVRWVASPDGAGDDLDPEVCFDKSQRPYLVWWRDEPGGGRVYLSSLVGKLGWSPPHLVSDPSEDSRRPTAELLVGNAIRIQFETPDGTRTEVVPLPVTDTITDDINPQFIHIGGRKIRLTQR
jgi:hypothetical protein